MTHRLEIKTVAVISDGCFSTLLWDGRPFGVSVERTFATGEAAHGKAVVVPPGLVLCRRDRYHKGGYETFEMVIAGHTRVLFHKGNLEDQSEACVITGESFGGYNRRTKQYAAHLGPDDQVAVLSSGVAFDELMLHAAGLREFYALVSGRP
jgi:hypothetical protein